MAVNLGVKKNNIFLLLEKQISMGYSSNICEYFREYKELLLILISDCSWIKIRILIENIFIESLKVFYD